jgi:KaiC/GvpD/RAD55 family RecA-like ATPase
MCKGHDLYYNPIDPTTIFKPSDTKAECLTTATINSTIEFRWFYRSNSSMDWIPCYNWSEMALFAGEYDYAGYLSIAGYWPGTYYPKAYKVEVYLDNSSAFQEFFEVTNGGLNSPRLCEDFDAMGNPVNLKSRFTVGEDTKAYHYLRFDNVAYFNEELDCGHNYTAVWIQPDGNIFKTFSGRFSDYKNTNITWDNWKSYRFISDYISINSSTPAGNWKVQVYLDEYYFNGTWNAYGPVSTTPFVVGSQPVADWTVMMYLDADNSLENASIQTFWNIGNITGVGSSSQVTIVAQMDRIGMNDSYGNWTDCKRFCITQGMTPSTENAIQDLGEVNMGDPATLKDFANWTMNNYPANCYLLVLWDHGAGFLGCCFDVTNGGNALSLPDLSQALSGLPAIVDVVLIGACSTNMIETAYQIKDFANVLIGPEDLGYEPAPYHDYFVDLMRNATISPTDFAKTIVTDYINWCFLAVDIQNATMSATDLTRITSLVAAVDDFALELKGKETPFHEQISLARSLTEGYQGPYADQTGNFIDLYHFAQLIRQYVPDEELQNAASRLIDALSTGNSIIMNAHKAHPNSHGLSIFCPDENGKYQTFKDAYKRTSFATGTLWDRFVENDLQGLVLTIQLPRPNVSIEFDNDSFQTDETGEIHMFVLPDYHTVNVTTIVATGAGSRLVFVKWNDSITSNPRTILAGATLTLTAEYETQYRLLIDRNFGTTNPEPGEHWCKAYSTVPISTAAPTAASGERFLFLSWTGKGNGGYSGTDVSTSIVMNEPINETAAWSHEYYLTVNTAPAGLNPQPQLNPLGPWYDEGSSVTCTAQDVSGKAFDHWSIRNLTSSQSSNWKQGTDQINVTIDCPYEAVAHYTPALWYSVLSSESVQIILVLAGAAVSVFLGRVLWVRRRKRKGGAKPPGPSMPTGPTPVLPGRRSTGFEDLDNLLLGGIPENYAVALTSVSCDERDLLIKRFLEAGLKEGQITFYVTTGARGVSALVEEFQSTFYLFLCNPRADTMIKDLPNVFKLKGVENLSENIIALTKAFRTLDASPSGPRRACIEIVSDVLLQHRAIQTRRWLTDIISELRSRGFTTLAAMNPQMHPPEEVHAILDLFDGEISIYEKETGKGSETFLKIKKMHNQRYSESELPLRKERQD